MVELCYDQPVTTDAEIRYHWLSPGKLQMTVTHRVAIEEYRYLFTEKPDGTVLDIEAETGC